MIRIMMLGAALLTIGAAAPPVMPDWLAGCWKETKGDRWTEECWMPPRGGIMLGAGRSGVGETVREWEAMQIVLGDIVAGERVKMAYWAAPGGSGRTAFAWQPFDGPGVTFYNVAHDYPQRIRYWRDGNALKAEISLADGGRPVRWTYRRVQ